MKQLKYKRIQQVLLSVYFITIMLGLINSCQGQDKSSLSNGAKTGLKGTQANETTIASPIFKLPIEKRVQPDSASKIGEYIREVFQDKNGNLWFGTLARGVARYDGKTLVYFSKEDGLVGDQVNEIAEDGKGNLWFATTDGVSKYDGKSFTNFTKEDGLSDNSTWSILADSKENIWVGTMGGVSRYDGNFFSSFPIPEAKVENLSYRFDPKLAWSIIEDKKGNIWFGTDGLGVCKYDGKSFSHFTRNDGLCNNNIRHILEDSKGDLWFGSWETRVRESEKSFKYVESNDGGLTRYDGKTFTPFSEVHGLSGENVGPMYEDSFGNIWASSMHYGAFRYDGEKFTLFKEGQGFTNNCIQSILEDKTGNLWFGFSGGLFRLEGMSFVNITKDGPW